jgi:hypothetical protein
VIHDRSLVPYQLIQPVLCHCPIALRVSIHTVVLPRCPSVDRHLKSDGFAIYGWSKHKVKITSVKSKDDLSPGRAKACNLLMIVPLPRESPFI